MNESIFTEQLADHIIAIKDVFVRTYALITEDGTSAAGGNAPDTNAKKRSILIDSGNGGVTPEVLEELGIPYPEKIIITHEHGDHMNGCPNFPEATICISEQGESELLKIMPNAKTKILKDGDEIVFEGNSKCCEDTLTEDNHCDSSDGEKGGSNSYGSGGEKGGSGFDLEVITIPGHSKGHIALLEKNRRVIFTGDSIADGCPTIKLFQPIEEKTAAEYVASLKKLLARSEDFDHIYTGHGKTVVDVSIISEFIECVEGALRGEIEKTPSPSLLSPGFVYKKGRAMIYAEKV